jgi:hypothetical protein
MNKFKSTEELYFSYYLEELKEAGFIYNWIYESSKFNLTEKVELNYIKQMKNKLKNETEFLLHPSSITADFTIEWNILAEDIFYLNVNKAVKNIKIIPFRLSDINGGASLKSLIEIKPLGTFKANTSNISFPYKQKFVCKTHGIYIQKIIPFNLKPKPSSLFYNTFVPKKVIELETYKVNTKIAHVGDTKFKFKPITLLEYLNKITNG